MYYVIDAVRWGNDGHIHQVMWHTVALRQDDLVEGERQVVPVVDADATCDAHEVRVYVGGRTGQFFRMKACPGGIDADTDEAGTPLHERMAHLPTF